MGINLGIALGNAATSGLNTYDRLQQLRIQQERHAFEQEQWDQARADWARRDARNAAIGNAVNQAIGPSDGQSSDDPTSATQPTAIPQQDNPQNKAQAIDTGKDSFGIPYDAPTVRARPNAQSPLAGAPLWSGSPNANAGVSTQGALPDYTGQGTALSAAAPLNGGPAPSTSSRGSDEVEQTTVPSAKVLPGPATDSAQPIDATKPQRNEQGIDSNLAHAYIGFDGKPYRTSPARKLSPGELERAIGLSLMRLPDAEAVKEGSAMVQRSYQTSKEEHDYQVDQIVQQAVSSGDIVGALKKFPGVLSTSNLMPGNADAKISADGKSVTYTLNVPGKKTPVVETVTGDNLIDLLAKTAVGLKGLFNPQTYQRAVENNLKAQEVLAQQTTAAAHKSMADTSAAQSPSVIKKNQAEALEFGARGKYYADEGYRARKQGDYYGSGAKDQAKTMLQKANDIADAAMAADDTGKLTRPQAVKQAIDVLTKNPNANQNRDIPDSLKPLYSQFAQEVGNLNPNATNFNAQRIALQKKYAAFGVDTGYVDPFANMRGSLPPPGSSFFGGGSYPADRLPGGSFFGGGSSGKPAPAKSSPPSAIPATAPTRPTNPGMRSIDLPQSNTDDPLLRQQLGVETRGIPPFEDPLFSPIGRVLNGQSGR